MNLSDMQQKDIINLKDGKKVGKIIDVEIDSNGSILCLIVEPKMTFKLFGMGSSSETEITFKQIVKIGEDVILVEF